MKVDVNHLELPDDVEVCPICRGKGLYMQTYTAGCGGGYFRMEGPCDYCRSSWQFGAGLGYIMKNRNPVPEFIFRHIQAQVDMLQVVEDRLSGDD